MGAVLIDIKGPTDKGLAKRSNCAWDEQHEVRNIGLGERQGLGSSEEDDSMINRVPEQINNGSKGVNHVPAGPVKLQPQGPMIHWERFLPKRSLKVLLVENDDSTRHVVSALLRNCSYEVTSVANGLQAWKIIEDVNNHVDLVLTEVVMPLLSGIGLLCKIMSHKTFKNIPVIMMSPHDSMGLVFRCLSKGAIDFLVKPIRKNELKNLWQHVWRRCHSSSDSGSESGTHTKLSAKSRSNDDSENNTCSSNESDNGSIGLSIRDGSDNGSGTQSSWTKRATEVDSPRPTSPWHQLADTPDGTCAQVIHTKPEMFSSQRRAHVTETKDLQEQENDEMGENLEVQVSGNQDTHLEYQDKFSTHPMQNKLSELDIPQFMKEQPNHKSENTSAKQKDPSVDLFSVIASFTSPQVENLALEAPNDLSETQIKDEASHLFKELPPLELSLKRLGGAKDVGTSMHDDHNGLRHSDLSAFSKYNTAASASQAPTVNVGSSSRLDNSLVAIKTEIIHNSNYTPNQQSNGSSNNNTMALIKCKPMSEALNGKSDSVSAFKCSHSTAFRTVQNGHVCTPQQLTFWKAHDVAVSTDQVHGVDSNQQVQVQHHHHHYHHHHHHVHNMQHQSQLDHGDLSLKNMGAAASQCGSSDMIGGLPEGNGGYYSVNGSASGSKHGSNEQNGISKGLNAGVANVESDNGATGNSGSWVIDVSGKMGGNGADEDRLALREAALTKFRQKRKERCFEKKVRYQNRKRLAEQRPRIRGQFVRYIEYDNTRSDTKVGKDKQESLAPEDNSRDIVQ